MTSADRPRRRPPPPLVALLLALAAAAPRPARGDDNHYQNYIVGERAVGFAGAFTAVADDGAAVYYNPAGLALLAYSSVNVSGAVYGFKASSVEIPGAAFEGGAARSDGSTFLSYPTTAAWIQRVRAGDAAGVGRVQLAFALISPFSDIARQRTLYRTRPRPAGAAGERRSLRYVGLRIAEDDTLWVGAAAAWRPLPWLAVGATLFGTLRSAAYQLHAYDFTTTTRGAAVAATAAAGRRTELLLKHYGLLGLVGVTVAPTPELRAGLTFRTPLLRLGSSVEANVIATTRGAGGGGVARLDASGAFEDRQPLKATLGLAWIRPRRFGLALDLSVHGSTALYDMVILDGPAGGGRFPMKKRVVWQLNVGGEIYPLPQLAIRAGFFTNLSSFDSPGVCDAADDACIARLDNPFADAMDRLGVAGSVGYEMDRATLTLGVSYTFGSARRAVTTLITAEERRSLLFVLVGASFRFGAAPDAAPAGG